MNHQVHVNPDLKELMEMPDEEIINGTRNAYSMGAEVFNFVADEMALMIADFNNLLFR